MKIQQIALVCLLALSNGTGAAQVLLHPDSIYTFSDPHMQKKYPWRAAAETVGTELLFHIDSLYTLMCETQLSLSFFPFS